MPPGLIVNPNALDKCSLLDFHIPRDSPFEDSRSGESCPTAPRSARSRWPRASAGARCAASASSTSTRRRASRSSSASPPTGRRSSSTPTCTASPDGSYAMTLEARGLPPVPGHPRPGDLALGHPLGRLPQRRTRQLPERGRARLPLGQMLGRRTRRSRTRPTRLPDACRPTAPSRLPSAPPPAPGSSPAEAAKPSTTTPAGAGRAHLREPRLRTRPLGLPHRPRRPRPPPATTSASPTNTEALFLTRPRRATPPIKQAVVTSARRRHRQPLGRRRAFGLHPGPVRGRDRLRPQGEGCPNGSKIGDFTSTRRSSTSVRRGDLPGPARRADRPRPGEPLRHPDRRLPGRKAPERGILVKLAGRIVPDPATGDLTATFDGLPQLPYTDLNVRLPRGPARLPDHPAALRRGDHPDRPHPLGSGAPIVHRGPPLRRSKPGSSGGPCPAGHSALSPRMRSPAAINSNVGSYTPYFVHLTRRDTEQEITSYSLILPKGITGKLAGVPFCPEAAIAAARAKPRLRRDRQPLLPGRQPGRPHLHRLRGRPGAHLRPGPHLPRRPLPRRAALPGHGQLRHGRPLRPRHDRDPLGLPGRPAHRPAADRLQRLGPDPPHPRGHPAAPARRPHLHGPLPVHPQPLQLRSLAADLDPDRLRRLASTTQPMTPRPPSPSTSSCSTASPWASSPSSASACAAARSAATTPRCGPPSPPAGRRTRT